MSNTKPMGPFMLVSVNKTPERSRKVLGQVAQDLSDQFTIIHAANCDRLEDVEAVVRSVQPDILLCASMWTSTEIRQIKEIAQKTFPSVKVHALPEGLQVEKGPDAVVEYAKTVLPPLIEEIVQESAA